MNPLLLRTGALMGTTGIRRVPVITATRFHTGRAYHVNKEQSELHKLTELMRAHNAKLDSINSRVKALEESLTGRAGISSVGAPHQMNGSISTESQVSSFAPKRIRIHGKSFTASKISKVSFRHSIMWWAFPYVVEVNYQKRTTEFLFGGTHFMIPITSESESHKLGCRDKTSAIKLVKDIKSECPHL